MKKTLDLKNKLMIYYLKRINSYIKINNWKYFFLKKLDLNKI